MVALLGMLAVAGYQNRDKLGSMLGGMGGPNGAGNTQGGLGGQGQGGLGGQGQGGLGGMLGNVLGGAGGGMAGGGLGSVLSGGLGDLMDRFNGTGQANKAQSWIGTGQNEAIEASELEQVLGPDTMDELQQKTGLSRQELLERLSRTLPDAVNHFTPDGRIPTETEASRFL
jgi:uncharacterized protein YidB (DUF937 family)